MKIQLVCLANLMLLAACAAPQSDIPAGINALPSLTEQASLSAPTQNYRIGVLDELSVIVFREPELSVEKVVVDVSGKISLPVAGEINVFGLTTAQVSEQVANKLNARYLRDAEVAISVTKATSYIFTVEGEVKKPGTYQIPGSVSLLQAVAIGEGLTEKARLSDVIVFRRINGQRYAARFNVKEIRQARAEDPELQPGDTVVVGYSTAKQIYRDIITALPGVAGIFVALNQN